MKIYPKEKIDGVYDVPSDKYAAQCAIILASMAKGKTTVTGRMNYPDVSHMVACVKKLGAKIKRKGAHLEIKGIKGYKQGAYRLECGNSGATMRLLCGLAAGANIEAVLTGGKYLSKRNMKGVKEPLEKMGATVALTGYTVPPVWVEGAPLKSIGYETEELCAQEKAAILLAALESKIEVTVTDFKKTDDSAEILLKEMGADISVDGDKITLKPSELSVGKEIFIGGDVHNANVLLSLGVLLGRVTVKNVCVNERKSYFIQVLKRMGADIEIGNERLLCGEIIGDVTARKSRLKATHVDGEEAERIADDLPLLAVMMGTAEGESIIVDIREEFSDSVVRTPRVNELINGLGGRCEEFEGGLLIKGVERYAGGNVKTYSDHKIALAGAVALCASENGGDIDDENCVSVSFPDFFELIKRRDVGVIGKGALADAVCDMHAYILSRLGLSRYGVSKYSIPEDNARRFFNEMRGHIGYSVFYPYCNDAAKSVSSLSPTAKALKSIDAVAGNTGYSFVGNGTRLALKFIGEDLSGKKVLVIGSGNAAKSVIHTLINLKAQITVYSEDSKSALEIAKKTKYAVGVLRDLSGGEYYAVLNATPVGSGYYEETLAVPENIIDGCKLAVDLVYGGGETPLLRYAKERGKKTVAGSDIAFFSAYLSDVVFFDVPFSEGKAFADFDEYTVKER